MPQWLSIRSPFPLKTKALAAAVTFALAASQAYAATASFNGPITITKGGVYSGNWESKDPNVPAVRIKTSEPVTIQNSNIRGVGHLIHGVGVRLTVKHTRGVSLRPRLAGRAPGNFIHLVRVMDLRAENNTITGGGIYVNLFTGSNARGEGVRVLRNSFRNIDGRVSDANGNPVVTSKYESAREIRNAVMFNQMQRVANAQIAWNEIINEPGKSLVEDNINMYVSSGTPESPILIHDNYVQGAYPTMPGVEAWFAGGGIILGDGIGNDPSDNGHVRVYNNQVVSTTNYGLSIVGGVDNHVYGNRVVNSGRLPDGSRAAYSNVGLVMWDFSKVAGRGLYARNVMRDNTVAWTRVAADGSVMSNTWWWPDCQTNGSACGGNTVAGAPATLEAERQEYTRWQGKLASARVAIGAQGAVVAQTAPVSKPVAGVKAPVAASVKAGTVTHAKVSVAVRVPASSTEARKEEIFRRLAELSRK